MNNKRLKRVYLFFVILAVMLLGSLTAQAATPKIAKTKTVYAKYTGGLEPRKFEFDSYIKINGLKAGDRIVSMKASGLKRFDEVYFHVLDKTVNTVGCTYYKNRAITISGELKSKASGFSFKVFIKIKRGRRVYSSNCTVKVERVPYVIKEIKIGGKRFAGKIRNDDGDQQMIKSYAIYDGNKTFKTRILKAGNKKLTVKAMPGIKIDGIMINEIDYSLGFPVAEFCTNIRNNETYTFEKGKVYELHIYYSSTRAFMADNNRDRAGYGYDYVPFDVIAK